MQLACLNIVQVFLGALGLGFGPFGADSQGYRGCVGGEFSMEHGGGIKLGQVYVQTRLPDSPTLKIELSDQAMRRVPTILTLLVVAPTQCSGTKQELASLLRMLSQSGIDPAVLSEMLIVPIRLLLFLDKATLEAHEAGVEWLQEGVASISFIKFFPS